MEHDDDKNVGGRPTKYQQKRCISICMEEDLYIAARDLAVRRWGGNMTKLINSIIAEAIQNDLFEQEVEEKVRFELHQKRLSEQQKRLEMYAAEIAKAQARAKEVDP